MNLSKKDSASIAKALKEAEALVETLSKMVGADNGLLHMHAQDLQASALNIQGKLKLIQTVTNYTGE
ncbi:hypothetical protein AX279_17685 [Pseudomonas sp. J237]|nr:MULTISPECIES: hypothetical protein [Pseudomonas]OEO24500.1 hypothetical protein AX279_17685 [Pseudomonas sp. J237]CRN68791.1 hypothetical protein PAERUG_P40_Scotland_4_VIM_2_09_12_04166 [Pseudomonas aeruginosa]